MFTDGVSVDFKLHQLFQFSPSSKIDKTHQIPILQPAKCISALPEVVFVLVVYIINTLAKYLRKKIKLFPHLVAQIFR